MITLLIAVNAVAVLVIAALVGREQVDEAAVEAHRWRRAQDALARMPRQRT